jgi:hypothetical protein
MLSVVFICISMVHLYISVKAGLSRSLHRPGGGERLDVTAGDRASRFERASRVSAARSSPAAPHRGHSPFGKEHEGKGASRVRRVADGGGPELHQSLRGCAEGGRVATESCGLRSELAESGAPAAWRERSKVELLGEEVDVLAKRQGRACCARRRIPNRDLHLSTATGQRRRAVVASDGGTGCVALEELAESDGIAPGLQPAPQRRSGDSRRLTFGWRRGGRSNRNAEENAAQE